MRQQTVLRQATHLHAAGDIYERRRVRRLRIVLKTMFALEIAQTGWNSGGPPRATLDRGQSADLRICVNGPCCVSSLAEGTVMYFY